MMICANWKNGNMLLASCWLLIVESYESMNLHA